MGRRQQQVLIWVLGLVVTAVMVTLGLWQMQTFRTQGEAAMTARMNLPPVALTSVTSAGGEIPRDGYGRPVTVRGTYLPQQQILVPEFNDPDRFRVLTALELPDGSIVPVVRGIATGSDVPVPPSGEMEETGLFLPSEPEPEREWPEGLLGSVRLPRVAQAWPQPMMPGFVSLDEASAQAHGLPAAVVDVPSSAGQARNSGYALQWWIFAAAAVAATVKLSRDAQTGTGLMASRQDPNSVDNPVDSVHNFPNNPTQDATITQPDTPTAR